MQALPSEFVAVFHPILPGTGNLAFTKSLHDEAASLHEPHFGRRRQNRTVFERAQWCIDDARAQSGVDRQRQRRQARAQVGALLHLADRQLRDHSQASRAVGRNLSLSVVAAGRDQDHHSVRHQRSARRRTFLLRRPARLSRKPARGRQLRRQEHGARPRGAAHPQHAALSRSVPVARAFARPGFPLCRLLLQDFQRRPDRDVGLCLGRTAQAHLIGQRRRQGQREFDAAPRHRAPVDRDRRQARTAAPDIGHERRRVPRRRVQLARLSLLQMEHGEFLARDHLGAARHPQDPPGRRDRLRHQAVPQGIAGQHHHKGARRRRGREEDPGRLLWSAYEDLVRNNNPKTFRDFL